MLQSQPALRPFAAPAPMAALDNLANERVYDGFCLVGQKKHINGTSSRSRLRVKELLLTKIIWMSDPHFQSEGTIDGLNPRTRLATAIEHANIHHADADFAILSGDLVGDDIDADYAAIASYLAKSAIPIYPMMGNNDDRDGFRKHLTMPAAVMPGFIQYVINIADGLVICLDTHKIGSHAGQFCDARQQWVNEVLHKAPDKPAYIFMHHPPLALGLPKQDEIMLEEDNAFLDLVSRHEHVKHLFMGHVHRPTCGTIRGIPFATLGALSFQAPAPRPEWDWESFVAPQEAPHYGVLHIENGDVALQYTQFCAFDVGITNPSQT
jgi:3',5'-cyclic AMP phosphodiesterase CpdA